MCTGTTVLVTYTELATGTHQGHQPNPVCARFEVRQKQAEPSFPVFTQEIH